MKSLFCLLVLCCVVATVFSMSTEKRGLVDVSNSIDYIPIIHVYRSYCIKKSCFVFYRHVKRTKIVARAVAASNSSGSAHLREQSINHAILRYIKSLKNSCSS